MNRPRLVGIGEILWDMLPSGKQLGGAPANFAYQANALGGSGIVVSRVGDDPLGREILDRIGSRGLDRQFIKIDNRHPTGTVDVRVDAHGAPDYVIHRDVAWDYLETGPSEFSLARSADCVCFGTLGQRNLQSRKAIGTFLQQTRPECYRIFDINLRQDFFGAEEIAKSLDVSRVLKLNDAELPVVGKLLAIGEAEAEVIESLLSQYPLLAVALTRGPKGSSIFTRDEAFHQPAALVKVVDTVGAGDAFTAAMALGLCSGMGWDEIGLKAARAGAYVCSQAGAMPAMPAELRLIAK